MLANLRNLALAEFRAATDALTGLPNSRAVQDTLKRMVAQASRTVSPLAALMLDLDHFKQINDTYGHAAGDDVLAARRRDTRGDVCGRATSSAATAARSSSSCCPDTGRDEAEIVAEKIRAAVAAITRRRRRTRRSPPASGSPSYPDDARDSVTLLRHADRALYTAKANGRNRVVSAALAGRST